MHTDITIAFGMVVFTSTESETIPAIGTVREGSPRAMSSIVI